METLLLNSETGLNTKTGLRVKIYRSTSEIDETAWDAVCGKDRTLCSYGFMEVLEKSGLGNEKCYYPVVYDGDEMIAHTSVYLMSTEMDLCAQGTLKNIIGTIRGKWKGFFI